jgi:carbon-monoxide dehydrogenase medium subunit
LGEVLDVKPAAFAYAKARSLDHAVELLTGHEGARILAGGQSLMPALNMRLDAPSLLVDINGIQDLDGIARKNGGIEIGALVRHAAAERSPVIAQAAPLIAQVLPHIGHPAIRNRGTIGGSIALADPAAELPACLLALGGEVEIVGRQGPRAVSADDFFKGLFETALSPGEVLTAIRIPVAEPSTRTGFAELCRRHGDYAMAGLAASARADGGKLSNVRLAFFGVGTTAVRARQAEVVLSDGPADEERLAAAVAALSRDLDPQDDIQCTGAVKKHLAGILLRRVVNQLRSMA